MARTQDAPQLRRDGNPRDRAVAHTGCSVLPTTTRLPRCATPCRGGWEPTRRGRSSETHTDRLSEIPLGFCGRGNARGCCDRRCRPWSRQRRPQETFGRQRLLAAGDRWPPETVGHQRLLAMMDGVVRLTGEERSLMRSIKITLSDVISSSSLLDTSAITTILSITPSTTSVDRTRTLCSSCWPAFLALQHQVL